MVKEKEVAETESERENGPECRAFDPFVGRKNNGNKERERKEREENPKPQLTRNAAKERMRGLFPSVHYRIV